MRHSYYTTFLQVQIGLLDMEKLLCAMEVPDVQVHDLMMYIEASRSIEAEGGQELRDASLLASPEAPQQQPQASAKRLSRRGR